MAEKKVNKSEPVLLPAGNSAPLWELGIYREDGVWRERPMAILGKPRKS